jgi:multiple sugar transport system permease protein
MPPTLPESGLEGRNRLRQDLAGWLWVSPWVVGFVVFMLIPIGMSLYYSFTDFPLLEGALWVGTDNYRRLLQDADFWLTLKNTVIFVGVSIPLCTVISIVLAALLNRARGRDFFQAAIFLPSLVPLAAGAIIFSWLFNGEYGLVNRVLALVGIDGPPWLLDRNLALPAVIIVGVWGIGQAVVLYVAAMQDVPEQLYEAADLDGMGPFGKFWNVTLPMISPVILFNVITMSIGAFQAFIVPFMLFDRVKGGPDRVAYFSTHYLFDNAFAFDRMGYASALAWVQLLIVLAFTGVVFLVSRKLVFYRGS